MAFRCPKPEMRLLFEVKLETRPADRPRDVVELLKSVRRGNVRPEEVDELANGAAPRIGGALALDSHTRNLR